MVKEILAAKHAELLIEAGKLLVEGVEREDQTIDVAKTVAKEVIVIENALTVLNSFFTEAEGGFARATAIITTL